MEQDDAPGESKPAATKWWVPFGLAFLGVMVLVILAVVMLIGLIAFGWGAGPD